MTKSNLINKNKLGTNSRIQWLDICKGILIFCVLLSHSYPPKIYEQFFTPFFLTMFFFVSGYTFSTKNSFKEFIANKSKRLLIPFLVLGLPRVIITQLIDGGNILLRLKGFVLQINGQYDEMWFVSCLFTCSLLFYFVVTFCRRQKQFSEEKLVLAVSLVLSALAFIDICIWKIKFLWELETAFMMLFYMALGYWYRRHETGTVCKFEKAMFAIPLAVFYTCIVLLIKNDVNIHKQIFEFPILFILTSLIVILPIIYFSKLLSHSFLQRVLVFLGENTLFYYAYGGIIRIIFYACCNYLHIENEWIFPILCALMSTVLMAFPAWFVKKYLPFAVGASRKKSIKNH